MNEWIRSVLPAAQYIPHGHCYLWQTPLVSLHVVSDLLIAIAYFSIPAMLVYFVRRRRDTPFRGMFLLFGAFIAACGLGHLLDIWTLWFPNYWASGLERAVTGFISCLTAIKLVEWMPQFLALRSPQELEQLNQELQQQVTARQRDQQMLHKLAENTAATTGAAFFSALVQTLAEVLEVRYAYVTEWDSSSSTIRSLAVWSEGVLLENFAATEQYTPCSTIVESGSAHYYPDNLQRRFSQAHQLTEMGVHCYLGVPLLNSQGEAMGTLCVAHDQPLNYPQEAETVMTIFAARAAAELQRQRAEATLRMAYTEMERRVSDRTHDLSLANETLTQVARYEQATSQVIQQMRQSLDLEAIFRATTQALRQAIACDRVIIYRFNHDWSGDVIAESVAGGWRSLLLEDGETGPWQANVLQAERCTVRLLSNDHNIIQDTYIQETQGGIYNQGTDYLTVEDIYTHDFTPCYIELLESLQARAYLNVPIYAGRELWGLLACYQNTSPRSWQDGEIRMVVNIGAQLGVATQQAELFQHTRQQAKELQQAKEVADRANQAKSHFLASMSHELRTPLNAILGFAQLMHRDPDLSSRHRNYLDIINTSGEHLLGLINNVLEMSKIEAGRLNLQKEEFNLPHLLQEIKDLLSLKAQNKGLTLTVNQAADLPQTIGTDQSKLRQVLLNLLGNSIKFTDTGSVSLSVASRPSPAPTPANLSLSPNSDDSQPCPHSLTLEFQVEDTGGGIAAEELDALFQPFQQTQSGLKSGQGTGLGIPISRQYVQLMGGDMEVSSTLGEGTRFIFTVQVELSKSSDDLASTPRSLNRVVGLAANQPRYRILVAEDNPINQLLMQKLLEPLEIDLRIVGNGKEACQVWETWQPHLIWMDMRMPQLDGYEATRQIRAAEARNSAHSTVIIALTATAFEESRPAILGAGCDDMVCKPFKPSDLLEKLQAYLNLEYRYETSEPPPQPLSNASQLHPDLLATMPIPWIKALRQAAAQCSDLAIMELVRQIPPDQAELAEKLHQIVHVFQFDRLLELTNTVINASHEATVQSRGEAGSEYE